MFNIAHKIFLYCLLTLQSVCFSRIVQYPAVLKAYRGETASLICDTTEVLSKCDSVFWIKVHSRTREMNTSTAVHNDPDRTPCTGLIYNTSREDSGIYYCSVTHTVSYTGNGSTLIVTDRHPRPIIMPYVSDVSVGVSVFLQCVVMGVVPSEVNVLWVVGESKMPGWMESDWTDSTNDSAVEYTRAHISIPSATWMEAENVECVVEVDGKRVAKSLKQVSSYLCSWLMYVCVVLAVLLVFIITLVYLRFGWCCGSVRSTKKINRQNGGKRRTDRLSVQDVQYASLDLISYEQQGNTVLKRNVLLNE